MVRITSIKQKYYMRVSKEDIDEKLKEIIEGIKGEVAHKGYGDIKITVDITFMSEKETQIYIGVERK